MRTPYDVVVIGAGLGGLTCAAYCAKAGLSTAVFEQFMNVGGCCQSFKRGGFLFDASVHSIFGARNVARIFEELEQPLELVSTTDSLRFPGVSIALDTIPQIRDDLAALFPAERENIYTYYRDLCSVVRSLLRRFMNIKQATQDTQLRFGSFYRYFGRTTAEIISQYTANPELQSLMYSAQMGFLSDRAWLFTSYHIYMERNYLHDHAQVAGGTQNIPDRLADVVRAAGGDVYTKQLVKRICLEDGRTTGIELADGTIVAARHVVSNADARLTFGTLLPPDAVEPAVARSLQSWRNSISFIVTNLGLSGDVRDLGVSGSNIAYFPTYDVQPMVRDLEFGHFRDDFWLGLSFPSVVDPSRAPPGDSVAFLLLPIAYETFNCWETGADYRFDGIRPNGRRSTNYWTNKLNIADRMIDRAEEILPGMRSRILQKNIITPVSIERITLNNRGTGLAWMLRPHELKVDMGLGLPIESRIPGFHYVGGWTRLGCGVSVSMLSGKVAAYHILGRPEDDVWVYRWDDHYVKE